MEMGFKHKADGRGSCTELPLFLPLSLLHKGYCCVGAAISTVDLPEGKTGELWMKEQIYPRGCGSSEGGYECFP